MSIKEKRTFDEEKKNGMNIVTNMNGEERADKKLMASTIKEFSDAEIVELKNLGYSKELKDPSLMSSKGRSMGIKILKDILKVNKQR